MSALYFPEEIELITNQEFKNSFISLIQSINNKFSTLESIIKSFNEPQININFSMDKKVCNTHSIYSYCYINIFNYTIDLMKFKFIHDYNTDYFIEKKRIHFLNILFNSFDFEALHKELKDFIKFCKKIYKDYVKKSFDNKIKDIKKSLKNKETLNSFTIDINGNFDAKLISVFISKSRDITESQINTINEYYKDFFSLFNLKIDDDKQLSLILKFDSTIVFEKFDLIKHLENF